MNIPDNLSYTKDHEWIKLDEETATIGITDYAQSQLGDVVFVELPDIESQYKEKESIGVVESVKTVSDIYAPLSGTIIETNEEVENSPELLNSDPYGKGWIVKLTLENVEETKTLLSAEEYTALVKEEQE